MNAMRKAVLVLTLVLAAFAGGLVMQALTAPEALAQQAAPADGQVLRARQIVLVDAEGRDRMVLAVADTGAVGIRMLDAHGQPAIELGHDPAEGNGLSFYDLKNNMRMGLGVVDDGSQGLVLNAADGAERLSLGADEQGNAGVSISNALGKVVMSLGTGAQGTGLALREAEGPERAGIGMGSGGGADLFLNNGNTTWRASQHARMQE